MASTTFSPGTVIASSWLNAVNNSVYNIIPTLATLNSPVFVTPTLGSATATSINKVSFTPVTTGATWNIANLKTFTVNNTLTLSGTDGAVLTLGAGTTLVSGVNSGDQTLFKYISVTGQPTITASSNLDTLRFVAGTGMSLTTDSTAKSVTVSSVGPMALLGSFTVSTALTSLDFTNIFSSDYDNYMVSINNLTVSATSTIAVRLAPGGTIDTGANYFASGADASTGTGSTSVLISAGSLLTSGAGTGTIYIRNVNSTGGNKTVGSYGVFGSITSIREGRYVNAAAVNGFSIFPVSASTITGGTIYIYGFRNS